MRNDIKNSGTLGEALCELKRFKACKAQKYRAKLIYDL